MAPSHSKFGDAINKGVSKLFEGNPIDPVEFIYKESWLTLSSIGSIFTFGLVGSFRATIFDKIMNYILPPESFVYMKVTLPDIDVNAPTRNNNPFDINDKINDDQPNVIDFGGFVRESIIWIFMTLLLYLIATFLRFPDRGGITFNTNIGI